MRDVDRLWWQEGCGADCRFRDDDADRSELACGRCNSLRAEGTPVGKCSFAVTGDVTLNVEGIATKNPPNGKAMAAADYWQTDAQLRVALHALASLDSKKSKDAVERRGRHRDEARSEVHAAAG